MGCDKLRSVYLFAVTDDGQSTIASHGKLRSIYLFAVTDDGTVHHRVGER